MDYPGKVITKNAVIPTQTSAPGVWTLDDAAQAQKANSWPIPGVPNPISKSLRFNQADDTYLNRTPAVSGNRTTWTWSAWVKRSNLSDFQYSMYAGGSGSNYDEFRFNTSDQFRFFIVSGGSVVLDLLTTQVFRDPSAWYHFVVAYDSTQATSSNRAKLYVNGAQITTLSTATYPSQNTNSSINNSVLQRIGLSPSGFEYNGYMTEINFVDGQQLAASDFGMTDTVTGVWVPKKYTGTYGTNGFYVNFKDASNTTTIGYDYSGNGNNWNANNLSVTAGAGNDSLTDVPTPWVGYSLNGDTGGVVRGNYCTWNPLAGTGSGVTGYGWTLANGNLDYTATNAGTYSNTMTSTFAVTTGKWYLEITIGSSPAGSHPIIGVIETEDISLATSTSNFQTATYISTVRVTDGQKSVFGSTSYASYGSSLAAGDVLNIAIDGDNGKIWWGKNGTWFNSGVPASGTNAGDTFTSGQSLSVLCIAYNANGTHVLNAGQRPFAYTPPAGFLSLCTTNLPTPTIGATSTTQAGKYFNAVLWTGNNTARTITGYGFQPDFIWAKSRDVAANHRMSDAVRGSGGTYLYNLSSSTTGAENTDTDITGFASDGFTLGGATNHPNVSPYTYVGWGWKANGAGSSNTAGSITSTVSANTTAGFSIVTYTGNATAGATVGHGLGVAPKMIIIKPTAVSGNWAVGHTSIGWTQGLILNSTALAQGQPTWFNDTTPSSTVFTLGSGAATNSQFNALVAYCFAEVTGYSAFGSYTGNGSTDGPFVYTGFRPAFILAKESSGTAGQEWTIYDDTRNTYNAVNLMLSPTFNQAETTIATYDFLSNGFKLRSSDARENRNGSTYIYAAFAESPFKFANAR